MDYRAYMSGERRGFFPTLLRGGLWFVSLGYGLAMRLRNQLFSLGWRTVHHVEVPVISVGNLTTGGTGKTPLVCLIARGLRQRGYRVALISRGYGRGEAAVNDEALELEQRLPDVPHVQDPNRVAAARIAIDELETEILLMDDGFQHRRLHRDLDIVVIDATCPAGFGHVLPRGMLREPLASIRRADIAILSRSESVTAEQRQAIRDRYQSLHRELAWFEAEHQPSRLIDYRGNEQPLDVLRGQPVLAFCGIGNPAAFADTIRRTGADLVALHCLPDHARYDRGTMQRLSQWCAERAREQTAVRIVCTAKDLVKVRTAKIGTLPLSAIEIQLRLDDEDAFFRLLLDHCPPAEAMAEISS